jgi:imidazolonepropionase-like amidohydrolase
MTIATKLGRLAAVLLCATGLSAASAEPLAITNVTVIDGTGAGPRPGMTVAIDEGRIVSVKKGSPAPAGARTIDGKGKYLVPGFVDSNVHGTVYGNPRRRDTSVK